LVIKFGNSYAKQSQVTPTTQLTQNKSRANLFCCARFLSKTVRANEKLNTESSIIIARPVIRPAPPALCGLYII